MTLPVRPCLAARRVPRLPPAAWLLLLPLCLVLLSPRPALAQAERTPPNNPKSKVQNPKSPSGWPERDHFVRVLSLRDYNTRVVLLGTVLLGVSAGLVGTFTLLRKRALVGDVVSHASLPGIAIAFIAVEMARPGHGKALPVLLTGALIAGLVGGACTTAIRKWTRIREDAALAIVLSVFFGVGIALFTVIQNIPAGNAAGLHQFIFGKAASMVAGDVKLIALAALAVVVVCALLLKEFSLLCFDEKYAAAQGWPTTRLDLLLTGLVVVVTVIGLQSVGLLLVVAMLIIPAAAARFWTDRLLPMALISALLGGASACLGVLASALFPRLAAGAVIVLAAAALFAVSMLLGVRRGIVRRLLNALRVRRRVGRHDLLRALYEYLEPQVQANGQTNPGRPMQLPVAVENVRKMRTWTPRRLQGLLASARREGLVEMRGEGDIRLTPQGAAEARRVARNHRLWELYLINYADIAPSHVDRDADVIEHLLEPAVLEELESLLSQHFPQMDMPPSPHKLDAPADAAPDPADEEVKA